MSIHYVYDDQLVHNGLTFRGGASNIGNLSELSSASIKTSEKPKPACTLSDAYNQLNKSVQASLRVIYLNGVISSSDLTLSARLRLLGSPSPNPNSA